MYRPEGGRQVGTAWRRRIVAHSQVDHRNEGIDQGHRAEVALEVLEALTRARIAYCVLRGHEELPRTVSHDVDLAVTPEDLDAFEEILGRVAADGDYAVTGLERRGGFHSYAIVDFKPSLPVALRVDVWTDFRWKGLRWLQVERVVETRIERAGMFVASSEVTAYARFVKELLHHGTLRPKMREKLAVEWRPADASLASLLADLVGSGYGRRLQQRVDAQDWEGVAALCRAVRLRLLWRCLTSSPWSTLSAIASYVGSIARRIVRPHGQLVVLVGPDGSGKTTLCQMLASVVAGQLFSHVHCLHGRYGILPDLGRLLRRRRPGQHEQAASADSPRSHGLVKASLMLTYYAADFLLAWPRVVKWKARGDLVLADRYYYDYYFQKEWERLPRGLIRALQWLVPPPDLVVQSYCPPEVVWTRKPELTMEEFSRQQERVRWFTERVARTAVVATDVTEEESLGMMLQELLERLPGRRTLRGTTA